MPELWFIGRVCEEFHVAPHRAYWMWLNYPCGVLEEIMEQRSYASAKSIYDSTDHTESLPKSVVERVMPIEFAVQQARMKAAQG